MKNLFLILLLVAGNTLLYAQNVGIGTTTPNGNLHIKAGSDTSQLVIDAHVSQTTPLIRLRNWQGEDRLHISSDTFFNAFYGMNAGLSNRLPQGLYNTFIGSNAGALNTRGSYNTAVGRASFYNNRLGEHNTTVGYHSLFLNSGDFNTAVGSEALYNNTTGEENVAVGRWALRTNIEGDENTAVGTFALKENTYGVFNTATGNNALGDNTIGIANTAIGAQCLSFNTEGRYNTAAGYFALRENSGAASSNTGIGSHALRYNTTGKHNTGVGDSAGYYITTGNHNIALGKNSGVASGYGHIFNTISIGNYNYHNAYQNQAFLGNVSILWNGGNVNWTTFSDARIKTGVREDVKGLEFINRLRPVTYFRSTKAALRVTGNKDDTDYPGKYDIEKIKFSGFIAQEVEQAAEESGYEFDGVRKPVNERDLYSISYASFVVPLVKAVQEQQKIIEELQNRHDEQKKKNELLEARLQKLERMMLTRD